MSLFRHSIELRAAPSKVFGAFEDPEAFAAWWGPDGFSNTFHVLELRTGGRWVYTMHGPDGRDYPNESEFLEVVPGALVRVKHVSLPRYELSISLEPLGSGTRLSWLAEFENETFAEKMRDFLESANEQNLHRLAAVLGEGRQPAD